MSNNCRNCITRRDFLRITGTAAACCAFLPVCDQLLAAEPLSLTPIYPKPKPKVGLVFCHIPSGSPTWPTKDYDYAVRAKELQGKLLAACPEVDFTVFDAQSAAQAKEIIAKQPDADGFVVYALGIWSGVPDAFVHSGKPVVLVDDLYGGSGEVLIVSGVATRQKLPVVVVSSSEMKDVADAARLFAPIRAMKESAILDVTDADVANVGELLKSVYGCKLVKMGSKELASYYDKADAKQAEDWADLWMGRAKKVAEPSRDEIIKSGRMYQALTQAMRDNRADAITVDCLGMFYSGRISAYPCLSFFQINNDGSTGVCESDLGSTTTQLLMRYLTGRPGYVSDPVIDTSRDEIIYAHCVSTNKVYGPRGSANPYVIRSHAEDGKGAVVQSLMPIGQTVTTVEVDPNNKRMFIHEGKTTRNVDEPKACRTKLAAKTNAQRILENWDYGWHRVTFYGGYRKQCSDLAKLMGISVVNEDQA